jgi:hypothetical protein
MSEARPTVVAVLGKDDHGPCDGGGSTRCPHCGAEGRYVFTALMSDGATKQMMAGCLKTFRLSPVAKTCERALSKPRDERSRWDARIIEALDQLRAKQIGMQDLYRVCDRVAYEKRQWMIQKGWARR